MKIWKSKAYKIPNSVIAQSKHFSIHWAAQSQVKLYLFPSIRSHHSFDSSVCYLKVSAVQTYLHKSTDRRLYISFYTQLGAAATVTLPLTGCCFIVINLSMQFSLTHLPQSHRIHFGIFIIGFGRSCACGNGCEKHINYAHQLISIGFFQLFNFKARGRCKMCKQPSAESKCKYLSTFNGYLGSTVASRPDLHSEGNKEWNQEREWN